MTEGAKERCGVGGLAERLRREAGNGRGGATRGVDERPA